MRCQGARLGSIRVNGREYWVSAVRSHQGVRALAVMVRVVCKGCRRPHWRAVNLGPTYRRVCDAARKAA